MWRAIERCRIAITPKRSRARQRREHAAFGDAEHRPFRALAADMQAGIAVAGDNERIAGVVGFDQPPQRQRDALHMLLRLDTERSFGKRRAHDLRPSLEAQRLQSLIDAACHGFVRVRIDDADARARG
jgi:hypothetical protein